MTAPSACAEDVIRSLRAGRFWPPAAPAALRRRRSAACAWTPAATAPSGSPPWRTPHEHPDRASAGSGKTYALTTEYLRLLRARHAAPGEAGLRPEALLAATFTRKAAGEIADRMLSRLAAAALDDEALAELAAATRRPDADARTRAGTCCCASAGPCTGCPSAPWTASFSACAASTGRRRGWAAPCA